ncbi:hypothetical protein M2366_001000 [Aeromonas sp. BIGb0405]|jgi:hypothetical protein|uniref:hypothetical protein n=1 Tax=Aeromonas TaxID=642 RepID=UPI001CCF29FF|nr:MULTISPECIES: hypothetical protein [Aeromonas]MCS3454933.1 hypothetical protein [Aeromonas sp. BIGb0405]UBO73317.1 hypothetical protein KYK33_15960 [Aeromonas rivuli]
MNEFIKVPACPNGDLLANRGGLVAYPARGQISARGGGLSFVKFSSPSRCGFLGVWQSK